MTVRVAVARPDEIPADGCLVVDLEGLSIGLVRAGDRILAYENRCLHQGGPVCRGEVLGRFEEVLDAGHQVVGERFSEEAMHLVCPWHGWEYDLASGECIVNRRLRLRSFPVSLDRDQVYVEVARDGG